MKIARSFHTPASHLNTRRFKMQQAPKILYLFSCDKCLVLQVFETKESYNPTHGGYKCSRGNHYSKIEPSAYIAIENSKLQINERSPDGKTNHSSKGFKLKEALSY